jgi:hypothetical protein
MIEFGARQNAADETLPQARQQMRDEIRELAQRTPKPLDEIRARQEILERVRRQELVARASQHALRQIGDGIAWRALRYDRRAFTIFVPKAWLVSGVRTDELDALPSPKSPLAGCPGPSSSRTLRVSSASGWFLIRPL